VDGDTLTVAVVSQGSNGSVTINPNGTVTYTPNPNFHGSDSFTYTLADGKGGTDIATVTVTVNDAPVAGNDGYTTTAGAALTVPAPGVLGNDSDVDGGPLSAELVSGPANGTLTLNPDGSFTYTPSAGFSGTDSFTYRAGDGSAVSGTATVTITVSAADQPGVTLEPDPLAPGAFVLVVRGTAQDDNIDVKRSGNSNQIEVRIRSADFNFTETYPITFTRVVLYGFVGHDSIRVQDTVTVPAWLFGGLGNDQLQGGGGMTVLVGDDGDDQLHAGRGRSLVIGGRGKDQLKGFGSDAILIAGFTIHDANPLALGALMGEWTSTRSFAARGANLAQWLNASTVHDDDDEDLLIGGVGLDCFFACVGGVGSTKDRVNAARPGELITDTSAW
jgi:hypothetical protein